MTRCDRCGAGLSPTDVAYHVWIWVVARVGEEVREGPWSSLEEAVADVSSRRQGVPEELVASDVHAARSFLVCVSCKERLLADPLGAGHPHHD